MKKFIAFILSLILTFSMFVIPVSAQEFNTSIKTDIANTFENTTDGFNSFIQKLKSFLHKIIEFITTLFGIECPLCNNDASDDKTCCIINFDLNYENTDNIIPSQKVIIGEQPLEPSVPERTGYIFVGWYTNKNYDELFLFDSDIVEYDMTLYAKWIKNDKESILIASAIDNLQIQYEPGDSSFNVTKNVYLMTNIEEIPEVSITWNSSNSDIISNTGKVTRPQDENVTVILTATVNIGATVDTKSFELEVVHINDKNLVANNYSVNDIQDMNNGAAIFEYNNDNNQVTSIDGKFTDITITDSADAVDAIQSVRTILGLSDAYEELSESVVSEDEYGGEYTFNQTYSSYRVYGRDITVSSDKDGVSDYLSSNIISIDKLSNMSFTPSIELVTATETLKTLYGDNVFVSESELVIYSFNEYENSPILVYIIDLSGYNSENKFINDTVFINAYNGDIIKTFSSIHEDSTATGSGIDEKGKKVSFPVQFTLTDWLFYYMYDNSTNVQMYNDGTLFDTRIGSEFNSWKDGQAISAYNNMRSVIKWWQSEFNRNSLDGNGMKVNVYVHNNDYTNNAFWSSGTNSIYITDISGSVVKYSRAVAADVLTHESTHAVIQYTVGSDFSTYYENAPGAINEGYADVFGCLYNKNWTHGEDLYTSSSIHNGNRINCTRNIATPASTNALSQGPDRLSSSLYVDYTVDSSDNGGVHTNGFLISHAAFLMKNAGMSYSTLGKLFYKSLRMGYTVDSDFHDVRKNVLKAADKLGLSSSEIQIIKNAFDAEEIYGDKGTINGTVKDTEGNVLSNASVNIYFGNSLVSTVTTNNRGEFSKSVETGEYTLKLKINNYIQYESKCVVEKNASTNLEIILVRDGIGTITGKISSATTAKAIPNVNINIRAGLNNKNGQIIAVAETNENGTYEFTINAGYYTLEFTNQNYTTTYSNITVTGGRIFTHNESLSPIMSTGKYRVVLTWGASPSDLDSHLSGKSGDGTNFHIYYPSSSKFAYDKSNKEIGNLDVDDTTSYGPETITFNAETTGTYYYYVYRYSSSGSLPASNANVKVYYGDNLVADYNIDSSANSSYRYWNIFKIENGIFNSINTVTSNSLS